MNFNFANKAPIVVGIDGTAYNVPRFLRRDFIAWAAEIDKARTDAATAEMSKGERFKALSVYPVMPVDHQELGRHVITPAGTDRVVRTCLARAGVPADVIERTLAEAEGYAEMEALALTLASLIEPRMLPAAPTPDDGTNEKSSDPLPSAANG